MCPDARSWGTTRRRTRPDEPADSDARTGGPCEESGPGPASVVVAAPRRAARRSAGDGAVTLTGLPSTAATLLRVSATDAWSLTPAPARLTAKIEKATATAVPPAHTANSVDRRAAPPGRHAHLLMPSLWGQGLGSVLTQG